MNKVNNNNNLNKKLNPKIIGQYICNFDSESINIKNSNYINILINKFNTINNNYESNKYQLFKYK